MCFSIRIYKSDVYWFLLCGQTFARSDSDIHVIALAWRSDFFFQFINFFSFISYRQKFVWIPLVDSGIWTKKKMFFAWICLCLCSVVEARSTNAHTPMTKTKLKGRILFEGGNRFVFEFYYIFITNEIQFQKIPNADRTATRLRMQNLVRYALVTISHRRSGHNHNCCHNWICQ